MSSTQKVVRQAPTPWKSLLLVLPISAGVAAGLVALQVGRDATGLFPAWYAPLFAGVGELVLMALSVIAALVLDKTVFARTGGTLARGLWMGAAAAVVSVIGFVTLQGGTMRPAAEYLVVAALNGVAVAVVGIFSLRRLAARAAGTALGG